MREATPTLTDLKSIHTFKFPSHPHLLLHMKRPDNIHSFITEPVPLFNRHEDSLLVPESHNPNCVIVYQHALDDSLDGQHIASIISGKPGENLYETQRASVEVYSNGPYLSFYDGIFGIGSRKGSLLIPIFPFPALAKKLRGDFRPEDDEERHCVDTIKSRHSNGRAAYFHPLADFRGCESLLVLANWNYFERRRMTWKERAEFLYPGTGGHYMNDLKELCGLFDLKLRHKNPHQRKLNALEACLNVIDIEFWERSRAIAENTLQQIRGNS